jgi:formylmethanofuran dehydrogenase subunit E
MLNQEVVDRVVTFHGHLCPGLAIGIRVAELVIQEMGQSAQDEELVAVVENDTCSVDAIQVLIGCTFGKGNLIFQDFGKNVYRFYRRADGKAIRISVKKDAGKSKQVEYQQLIEKRQNDKLSEKEKQQLEMLNQQRLEYILQMPLEELFELINIIGQPPEKARIHESLPCAGCGEYTMETRMRRINGEWYCLPCYHDRERYL